MTTGWVILAEQSIDTCPGWRKWATGWKVVREIMKLYILVTGMPNNKKEAVDQDMGKRYIFVWRIDVAEACRVGETYQCGRRKQE